MADTKWKMISKGICIIFDESHIEADITILKYFLQVLTPILPAAV
jgi:hypothetical protein